jgi:hypothetical protein
VILQTSHQTKMIFEDFPNLRPQVERINTSLILSESGRTLIKYHRSHDLLSSWLFGKVGKTHFYKLHHGDHTDSRTPSLETKSTGTMPTSALNQIPTVIANQKVLDTAYFKLETDSRVFAAWSCKHLPRPQACRFSGVGIWTGPCKSCVPQVQPRNSHTVQFPPSSQVSTLFMNAAPHACIYVG